MKKAALAAAVLLAGLGPRAAETAPEAYFEVTVHTLDDRELKGILTIAAAPFELIARGGERVRIRPEATPTWRKPPLRTLSIERNERDEYIVRTLGRTIVATAIWDRLTLRVEGEETVIASADLRSARYVHRDPAREEKRP